MDTIMNFSIQIFQFRAFGMLKPPTTHVVLKVLTGNKGMGTTHNKWLKEALADLPGLIVIICLIYSTKDSTYTDQV